MLTLNELLSCIFESAFRNKQLLISFNVTLILVLYFCMKSDRTRNVSIGHRFPNFPPLSQNYKFSARRTRANLNVALYLSEQWLRPKLSTIGGEELMDSCGPKMR